MDVGRGELVDGGSGRKQRFDAFEQFVLDFLVDRRIGIGDLIVGRDTYLVRRTDRDNAHGTVELGVQHITHFVGLHILVEANDVVASTRKVDTFVQADRHHRDGAQYDNAGRDEVAYLAGAQEVDLGIGQQVLRQRCGEGYFLQFIFGQQGFVYNTGQEDSREEGSEQADNHRRGKPADGAGTEIEEYDAGDDRGQVRVEDGRESVAVTVGDGFAQRFAGAKFFFGTFIDQHVGIDRHTERQHHTGDTGQREHGLEGGQNTHREEDVQHQGAVGDQARNQAVEGAHVNHQQYQGQHERDHAGVDGFLSERRAYHVFLYDADGSGHFT